MTTATNIAFVEVFLLRFFSNMLAHTHPFNTHTTISTTTIQQLWKSCTGTIKRAKVLVSRQFFTIFAYTVGQWFLTFPIQGTLFLKALAWGSLVYGYVISQSDCRCCLCICGLKENTLEFFLGTSASNSSRFCNFCNVKSPSLSYNCLFALSVVPNDTFCVYGRFFVLCSYLVLLSLAYFICHQILVLSAISYKLFKFKSKTTLRNKRWSFLSLRFSSTTRFQSSGQSCTTQYNNAVYVLVPSEHPTRTTAPIIQFYSDFMCCFQPCYKFAKKCGIQQFVLFWKKFIWNMTLLHYENHKILLKINTKFIKICIKSKVKFFWIKC